MEDLERKGGGGKVIISNESGALLDPVICVQICTVKAEGDNIVIRVRKAGRKTD